MPRLDFWRRLFHHTALGLASVCLLYAEAFFLPTPLLIVLYALAALQVLAFVGDGRRWVLPGWAANLLAGAVAGGGATWVGVELNSPRSVLADLPLPAGLLPYVGPVLIGLLVVKLFRPRTPRDFWLLQGVGALQVALACVLATNPDSGLPFALLLAAYVAAALGCLALHHFAEEQSTPVGAWSGDHASTGADHAPTETDRAPAGPVRLPFAYRMAPFCLRWTLAAAAAAAPLFLLTPRLNGPTWDSSTLSAAAAPAGGAPSGSGFARTIDLSREGPVRLGDAEVFRVAVSAGPGPAAPALPPDQRWRGNVLDLYSQGRWANMAELTGQAGLMARLPTRTAPPPVPEWLRFDFTVTAGAGGLFLAEPVRTAGEWGRITRAAADDPTGRQPLAVSSYGPVLPTLYKRPREYRYRQFNPGGGDPDRAPADLDFQYGGDALTQGPAPRLADWTARLLKRLAADPAYGLAPADIVPAAPAVGPPAGPAPLTPAIVSPRLPVGAGDGTRPVDLPPIGFPVLAPMSPRGPGTPPALPREGWERVGRALTDYLAHSGDYAYTLDLRRSDAALDPVMDFLVNVKTGHCERFASALALMLRSQGIPARVVVGFRGSGDRQADGAYVVRENQAHAWVEMMAPRYSPSVLMSTAGLLGSPLGQGPLLAASLLPPDRAGLDWVVLDPTPAGDAAPPPYTLWEWVRDEQRTGQQLWGGLVVNYNADQQAGLWAALQSPQTWSALAWPGLALPAVAAVCGLTWAGRRRIRRRRAGAAAAPAASGYARLRALLARHGGPRPSAGQTPREFAGDARRFLLGRPACAPFAGLPDEIVDRLYRVRFGGQALAADEAAAVEAHLGRLAAALRAR